MPRVPVYERQEKLRPLNQQGINVQASAADFGGGHGQGLQALGQGMNNLSVAIQAVEDEKARAQAKERLNKADETRRNAMFDPDNGFMFKEGRAAIDGRADFEATIDKAYSDQREGLSPRAQKYYDDAAQAQRVGALEKGIIHTGQQTKKWSNDASDSRIASHADDALVNYQDDNAVNQSVMGALKEVREQADKHGWDADTLKAKARTVESGIRFNVVKQMSESKNSGMVKAYIDKYRDRFSGEDLHKLTPIIKNAEATVAFESAWAKAQDKHGGDGMSYLRRFEGFRSDPYWDVNAHRVGYGSDTITREDGSVVRVQPGMTVSKADAERDLQRRVNTEFVPGIVRDVGADKWNGLSASARAALTSVAYNYGRLPFSVANAVASGNADQIASAVEGLRNHNNSVNFGRRMQEAAAIRNGTGGGGGGINYAAFEKEVSAVEDPQVQELMRKKFNSMLDMQNKAEKYQKTAAQSEMWKILDTGGTPDDFSPQLRQAIGMEGITKAWNYLENPPTDPVLLYEMRKFAAERPDEFSKLDLMDFRGRLGKSDFDELSKSQASVMKGNLEEKTKNLDFGNAVTRSTQQLEALGITTKGKKNAETLKLEELRIARFQNALFEQMSEFQRIQERAPSNVETQAMINRLLLPIVLKEKKSFLGIEWDSQTGEKYAFEAPFRPDGASVDIAVKYGDIPIDFRRSISRDLKAQLGREPTKNEVETRYEQFVLGSSGTR